MKKYISILIFIFAVVFNASQVMAQSVKCQDDDEDCKINSDFRFIMFMSENNDDEVKTWIAKAHNNTSPGFNMSFGLGYSMVASLDLNLNLGYDIVFNQRGTFGFGLYTNLHGKIGYPYGLDWALTPTFITTAGSFRFSLGLGIGLFMVTEYDYFYDDYDSDIDKIVLMQIKPELRFSWFIAKHFYLGFGIDLPLIAPSVSNSDSDSDDFALYPQIEFYFTLGVKLSND